MSDAESGSRTDPQKLTDVPVDWEALEDAFENNAPEVHSYLHTSTGEVLRVVDGIADPEMHTRIASDANYMRVDPVSSREQYRWMERFIPMVDEVELRNRLAQAIDGKGAFRRFKDVLMAHAPERERWFAFRSERCVCSWKRGSRRMRSSPYRASRLQRNPTPRHPSRQASHKNNCPGAAPEVPKHCGASFASSQSRSAHETSRRS